jgi:hypothetical protein
MRGDDGGRVIEERLQPEISTLGALCGRSQAEQFRIVTHAWLPLTNERERGRVSQPPALRVAAGDRVILKICPVSDNL